MGSRGVRRAWRGAFDLGGRADLTLALSPLLALGAWCASSTAHAGDGDAPGAEEPATQQADRLDPLFLELTTEADEPKEPRV